ncbi:hypothetical protein PBI_TEAMOCIL_76 [Microbacterium phage Teamocil]|uniref:Uncharacterized protein n=1 Tax=Microbacterium phage Teamocil TaxID=2656554 RepID=A0A649VXT4_9CAUD|nr:hypothetical protein QDA12_gp76 [Microbacterium phage Teamocil]QGJ88927.1 hypothetical protein PBI_GINA_76 [Microbacterium phage Gina]QGJ97024.1 hypothetical protein PBI_TEAMOCIL_76 [Microbacterium phage Teamocil]
MSRLADLIYEALGDAPSDHIVTKSAAREVADHVARALVQAEGGESHYVSVERSSWTIQHPLPERFEPDGPESLMECRFNALISAAMAGGAMFDGLHRVWIDRGVLQWEEVDGGEG